LLAPDWPRSFGASASFGLTRGAAWCVWIDEGGAPEAFGAFYLAICCMDIVRDERQRNGTGRRRTATVIALGREATAPPRLP
jgi:hypothetical protein